MKMSQAQEEYRASYKRASEMQVYLNQKFTTYANSKVKFELLVPSKGILEIIHNHIGMSQHDLFQEQLDKHKFEFDPNKIKEIKEDLLYKINLIDQKKLTNCIKLMGRKRQKQKVGSHSPLSSPKNKTTPTKKAISPLVNTSQKHKNISLIPSPRSRKNG